MGEILYTFLDMGIYFCYNYTDYGKLCPDADDGKDIQVYLPYAVLGYAVYLCEVRRGKI